QMAVDVLTQFFSVDACLLRLQPPGLPEVRAAFGVLPLQDERAVLADVMETGTESVTRRIHGFPVKLGDETVGVLAAIGGDPLAADALFESAAFHVSDGLASLVEHERLRRHAAVATARQLAAPLGDRDLDEQLSDFVGALAALPNVTGAELYLDSPRRGEPPPVTAGMVGTGGVTEREMAVADDVVLRVQVAWTAGAPHDGD